MNVFNVVRVSIAALCLAGASACGAAGETSANADVANARPVEAALSDLQGKAVNLADYRGKLGFGNQYSIQLSYGRFDLFSTAFCC